MARRRHWRARSIAALGALLRLLPLAAVDALAQSEQDDAAQEASAPAEQREAPQGGAEAQGGAPTEDDAFSVDTVAPRDHESPPQAASPELSPAGESASSPAVAPGDELEEPLPAAFGVMRNDDVVEMANAGFSERTIIAAIEANPTDFDVSPRVLVALKRAGVPESVIETMLAVETRQQQGTVAIAVVDAPPAAAETAPPAAAATPTMSPEAIARLSEALERLAGQTSAPEPGPASEEEEVPALPVAPRVWLVDVTGRAPFPASAAQVAYTDLRRLGSTSFKTLQGLASKALAFASPALSSGLSGLFGNDDEETTAVWALLGPTATRQLRPGAVFEIDFASIPGIDPAEYRPAIVQLVPTSDNYRLVGAVKTTTRNPGVPNGPIIEETLPADVVPLGRGRFRVTLGSTAPAGEYALVLRPIMQQQRGRRRNDNSLGALLGGASKDVLYLTWDFAIRA